MGSDDFIELDPPEVSNDGGEHNGLHDANSCLGDAVLQVSAPEIKDCIANAKFEKNVILNGELEHPEVGCRSEDGEQLQTVDHDGNVAVSQNQRSLLENVELTTTITVMNEITEVKSHPVSENDDTVKFNDDAVISDKIHEQCFKRARRTCDEQQPSVRVIYNSLTRSERKRLFTLCWKT